MPRIAILGWGSLVTHPAGDAGLGQEPLAMTGDWSHNGPELKLEFARVSSGRRLTLVIEPDHGFANAVYTVESAHASLDDAAENLRRREGRTRASWIGRLLKGEARTNEPDKSIAAWLAMSGYDGVVWTAIPPNFPDELKCTFSVNEALNYLESLHGEDRTRAHTYITEVPDRITTEVRRHARWPEKVAVHEAGHFVVACALGRTVIRLSRVPVDDRQPNPPTVGCRYADINCPQPFLLAGDFAGALAQLALLPSSVSSWKLDEFRASILLPADKHHLYSWTGWVEDVTPAIQQITYLSPLGHGLSGDECRRLERQVADFLTVDEVITAVVHVRDNLLANPVIMGEPLKALQHDVNAMVALAAGKRLMLAGFV